MGLVTLLVYTLYGIPSMYYGSEFGIEGKKEQGSDWNLRPHLELADYVDAYTNNPITALCVKLGELKKQYPELSEGQYQELSLTNRQFAYASYSIAMTSRQQLPYRRRLEQQVLQIC